MKFLYCFYFMFFLTSSISCRAAEEPYIVEINLENHKFDPAEIHVPPNKKLILVINNLDSTIEEFDSVHLKREKILRSHSKTNIVLAPLNPGRYEFVGEFHADTAQGVIVVDE